MDVEKRTIKKERQKAMLVKLKTVHYAEVINEVSAANNTSVKVLGHDCKTRKQVYVGGRLLPERFLASREEHYSNPVPNHLDEWKELDPFMLCRESNFAVYVNEKIGRKWRSICRFYIRRQEVKDYYLVIDIGEDGSEPESDLLVDDSHETPFKPAPLWKLLCEARRSVRFEIIAENFFESIFGESGRRPQTQAEGLAQQLERSCDRGAYYYYFNVPSHQGGRLILDERNCRAWFERSFKDIRVLFESLQRISSVIEWTDEIEEPPELRSAAKALFEKTSLYLFLKSEMGFVEIAQ